MNLDVYFLILSIGIDCKTWILIHSNNYDGAKAEATLKKNSSLMSWY